MVKQTELSLKDRIACDVAWRCLMAFCTEEGKPATSGELARELGISRNTAHKRLKQMLWQKAIDKHCTRRGDVRETRYSPANFRFPVDGEVAE